MSNGCHPNCTEAAEKIQLQEQLAVAMQLIVAQQGEISRLKEEVKSGLHFVDWCRRNLFGRKSERVVIEEKDASQSRQLWLGEEFSREAEVVEASADETSASTTVSPRVRTIRRANPDGYEWDSRLRFPEDIQVTEVHVDPPEIAGLSSSEFEIIGYEVSHKLAQEKASYTVVRYKRPIVKLKEQAQIVTAPLPPAVTERSIFDLTLHAGMLVDKFVYHIPLSRQWERMQGAGLVLSRATLVNQTLRAIEQLEPVYQAQKESVLSSSVIAMDDTWMNVGSSQPGRMHRGFFFPIYGDKHEVVFPYAENRRDQQVADLLGNYKGVVVADGHGAYDTYAAQHAEVVRAQCWVHTRRNFFEIEGLKDLRAEALKPDRGNVPA